MKCVDCRNCYKPENKKEVCLAGLWDRNDDEYLLDEDDFLEHINKERFCSDASSNHK